MQREPRVVQPFGQGEGGAAIVVVEVIAHREDLDGIEPVRRDLDQVIPIETITEIKVCRDPEHDGSSL